MLDDDDEDDKLDDDDDDDENDEDDDEDDCDTCIKAAQREVSCEPKSNVPVSCHNSTILNGILP